MNKAIISLGSNTTDRIQKLTDAMSRLSSMVEKATPPYIENCQNYNNPYLNIVAIVKTRLSYNELYDFFKDLEKFLGRVNGNRDDMPVAIDIDIVIFNDAVIRYRDYTSAYFVSGLKLLGLSETV